MRAHVRTHMRFVHTHSVRTVRIVCTHSVRTKTHTVRINTHTVRIVRTHVRTHAFFFCCWHKLSKEFVFFQTQTKFPVKFCESQFLCFFLPLFP